MGQLFTKPEIARGEDGKITSACVLQNLQRQIRLGQLTGATVLICGYRYGRFLVPSQLCCVSSRMAFTLKWQLPTAAILMYAIRMVALARKTPGGFDPFHVTDEASTEALGLSSRFLSNTLEQTVLFFISQMVLSTYLKPDEMHMIPVCSCLYVAGRVMFWRGYNDPSYDRTNRGYGLVLGIVPTTAAMAYCGYWFARESLWGVLKSCHKA